MTYLSYLAIIVGVIIWTPLLSGRRRVGQRTIEAITIFGGAFLFGSCFVNLVPHMYLEGFSTPGGLKVGAAVMVGFFIQLILEQLTGGIEHGNGHGVHKRLTGFDGTLKNAKATIPVAGLMIGLCLHGFLEGMPLVDSHGDIHQGLLWGIVLHNIPISLVLTSLFVATGTRTGKAFMLMLLFAVMTPLGSMFNAAFLGHNETAQCLLMGLVVGILLHVSVSILFGENNNILTWRKILLVIVALVAAYFTPGCPEIYG